MFNWLRKSAIDPLAVSMAGIKLADKLLVIGCSDPKLVAALASKVGLTGRACAVDDDEARVGNAATVAEREGVLIETALARGTIPYPDDSFDVVVLRAPAPSFLESARIAEARRVLRPGGRCVAIVGMARAGARGLLGSRQPAGTAATMEQLLTTASFVAVRTLAERGGLTFHEAVKKNL